MKKLVMKSEYLIGSIIYLINKLVEEIKKNSKICIWDSGSITFSTSPILSNLDIFILAFFCFFFLYSYWP